MNIEKIKEYIIELKQEQERCVQLIEEKFVLLGTDDAKDTWTCGYEYASLESRIQTLAEVENDLKNRLEETLE